MPLITVQLLLTLPVLDGARLTMESSLAFLAAEETPSSTAWRGGSIVAWPSSMAFSGLFGGLWGLEFATNFSGVSDVPCGSRAGGLSTTFVEGCSGSSLPGLDSLAGERTSEARGYVQGIAGEEEGEEEHSVHSLQEEEGEWMGVIWSSMHPLGPRTCLPLGDKGAAVSACPRGGKHCLVEAESGRSARLSLVEFSSVLGTGLAGSTAENSKRQDKELSHRLVEVCWSLLGRSGQFTAREGAWLGVARLHGCSDSSFSCLDVDGVRVNLDENLSLGMGEGNPSSWFSPISLNSSSPSSSSSMSELSHPR